MDREQVRRDAEQILSSEVMMVAGAYRDLASRLLAGLEQAERELRECRASFAEVESAAAQAKRDRDLIGAALAEPCAECGHIDWRTVGYVESVLAPLEARLAAVPALVEALREIEHLASMSKVGGPRMDGTQQYTSPRFGQIHAKAREALTAYEQAQGETP